MTPSQSGFCETQQLVAGSREAPSLPCLQAPQRASGLSQSQVGTGRSWVESRAGVTESAQGSEVTVHQGCPTVESPGQPLLLTMLAPEG